MLVVFLYTQKEVVRLKERSSAIMLDVREQTEIKKSGVVSGAYWIPWSKIKKNDSEWRRFVRLRQDDMDKSRPIITYCIAGVRARKAAKRLLDGKRKLYVMKSFYDWRNLGLPTTNYKEFMDAMPKQN